VTNKDRVRCASGTDKRVCTGRRPCPTLHDHSIPCYCQQRRSQPSQTRMDVLIVIIWDTDVTNSCRVGTVVKSSGHVPLYPGHRHLPAVWTSALVPSVSSDNGSAIDISLVMAVLRKVHHASTQSQIDVPPATIEHGLRLSTPARRGADAYIGIRIVVSRIHVSARNMGCWSSIKGR
jgi:hypothetical protein